MSLCGVTAHALALAPTGECEVQGCAQAARVSARGESTGVAAPRARAAQTRAREAGADTETLRRMLAC
jgi:hypothetical protein